MSTALQLRSSMRVAALVWVFVVSVSAQTLSSAVPAEIQVLLTTHDYPKAEQAIKEKLAASPAWHTGHVLLAQIYNATGRYELAERSGLAAVKLRESVDALLALAVATLNQRKLNDSIEWLDKAAKRQPGNPEIYKILGLDYAMGGMLRESGQAFRAGRETRAGQLGAALSRRARALRARKVPGFRDCARACNRAQSRIGEGLDRAGPGERPVGRRSIVGTELPKGRGPLRRRLPRLCVAAS